MAANPEIARLLAIVPYIANNPGVTMTELARAFGVSTTRIGKDLDTLFYGCSLPGEGPGDFIDLTYEGDTIYLNDPQNLDRPMRLTADEATALLVAARALADLPDLPERAALETAIEKLEQAVEPPADVEVVLRHEGEVLELLRRALQSGRAVRLRYLAAFRNEESERVVDPGSLQLRQGHWYLVAWCRTAEAMRTFRVDRVLEATELEEAARPPAVDAELAEGVFVGSPSDFEAVLTLTRDCRWFSEYAPAEALEELPGGSVRMTLRVADREWLVASLLRLGAGAVVERPEDVAAEVRSRAAAALALYA